MRCGPNRKLHRLRDCPCDLWKIQLPEFLLSFVLGRKEGEDRIIWIFLAHRVFRHNCHRIHLSRWFWWTFKTQWAPFDWMATMARYVNKRRWAKWDQDKFIGAPVSIIEGCEWGCPFRTHIMCVCVCERERERERERESLCRVEQVNTWKCIWIVLWRWCARIHVICSTCWQISWGWEIFHFKEAWDEMVFRCFQIWIFTACVGFCF